MENIVLNLVDGDFLLFSTRPFIQMKQSQFLKRIASAPFNRKSKS